jgi:hypothetical protein
VWREFDGFYVLYTAAALKIAKDKEVKRLVVVFIVGCRLSHPRLILADCVAGSQREAGQKET